MGMAAAAVVSKTAVASDASGRGLSVRFLGTGAADWNGRDERGELRRLTSLLVENSILVDYTSTSRDMLPEGVSPKSIFYTHSHGDHYQPMEAVDLGVARAYVHESWLEGAKREFAWAAEKLGKPVPEVIGLAFGKPVEVEGIRFTSLPANHGVSRPGERASLYLIEKDGVRLLYATDTGGIPADAARLAGIDVHRKGEGITALVMEATMGLGYDEDFRIYTHSSVESVIRTVHVLQKTGRYHPAVGQKVYLTHMARTLHGTHAEVAKALPDPIVPAYDGLDVRFLPPAE